MLLTTTTSANIALATAIVFASSTLLAKPSIHPTSDDLPRQAHKSTLVKKKKAVHPVPAKKTHHVAKKARPAVVYKSDTHVSLSRKETACLTRNVYHEARGEPYAGKLAVAQVTYNRVASRQWGSSVCKVVYAPSQFSWTADPSKRFKSPRNADWRTSQRIVADYTQGLRVSKLENARYFHATHLGRPQWTQHLKRYFAIGHHVFYA